MKDQRLRLLQCWRASNSNDEFTQLLESMEGIFVSIMNRYSNVDTEEMRQRMNEALYRACVNFKNGGPASFTTYATRILINECNTFAKEEEERKENEWHPPSNDYIVDFVDTRPTPDEMAHQREKPPIQRQLFEEVLKRSDECTTAIVQTWLRKFSDEGEPPSLRKVGGAVNGIHPQKVQRILRKFGKEVIALSRLRGVESVWDTDIKSA